MSGKGDDRRPLSVDEATFASNWDRIFAKKDLMGCSSTVEQESLKFSDVRSNRTTPATYARFENDGLHVDINAYLATKEGREKFASLVRNKGKPSTSVTAPHESAARAGQVGSRGPIYIDNATGREVCESWWPG